MMILISKDIIILISLTKNKHISPSIVTIFLNNIILLIILFNNQLTLKFMNLKQSLTKNKNISKICLRKSSLKQIPASIYIHLPYIVYLDISHNELINNDFDLVCHNAILLKKLIISNNNINIIPKSISKLVNLQFLEMDWHLLLYDCDLYPITNKTSFDQRIKIIQKYFNQSLTYSVSQNIKGITFKIFLQQICNIQLNSITKKKIIQSAKKIEIHQKVKEDIQMTLGKNTKRQIQIYLQNPQKSKLQNKFGCLSSFVKDPSPNKKIRIRRQDDSKCTSADRKIVNTPQKIKLSRSKSQKIFNVQSPRSKNKIIIEKVKNIPTIASLESPKSIATRETSYMLNFTNNNSNIDFSRTTNELIFNIFQHFDESPLTSMTIIQQYLKRTMNFNIYDSYGLSPFHYLIIKQQTQGLTYVLETNEKYNYPIFHLTLPNKSEKRNLLHFAAFLKNIRIIHILLEHGYPLNAHDYKGHRAIHLFDQNPEILSTYRKLVRKRKKRHMPDFIPNKCIPISRIQQQSQANGINLLKMYESAVNFKRI